MNLNSINRTWRWDFVDTLRVATLHRGRRLSPVRLDFCILTKSYFCCLSSKMCKKKEGTYFLLYGSSKISCDIKTQSNIVHDFPCAVENLFDLHYPFPSKMYAIYMTLMSKPVCVLHTLFMVTEKNVGLLLRREQHQTILFWCCFFLSFKITNLLLQKIYHFFSL